MHTVLDILQKTTDFFSGKGVESARLNAELIVGHALGLKRMQLYLQFERLLTEPELERIRPLVRRRGQREPLAYVLGTAEFCGLTLKADRRALVPRPETERLVELLQERCVPPPTRVLDLGTGTGCIALALASAWPGAEVVAVDASEEALALARENGESTGLAARVRWLKSDWFSGLPVDERFDLIVSNPPYLTAEETAAAEPEVRTYEPASALTAAEAGMADLRKIIAGAPRFLAPGGWLAMETGIAQHAALLADLARAGLHDGESVKDLADRDRFVVARAG
ncbi:MAG TPA: peptide chain release factor N(5)-glutamine methyltransferase [Opitutaceae bacterium]|nr:peptide chain release factor N(5)-glutamine methyltransferase [Opitutaceae bacterium]